MISNTRLSGVAIAPRMNACIHGDACYESCQNVEKCGSIGCLQRTVGVRSGARCIQLDSYERSAIFKALLSYINCTGGYMKPFAALWGQHLASGKAAT